MLFLLAHLTRCDMMTSSVLRLCMGNCSTSCHSSVYRTSMSLLDPEEHKNQGPQLHHYFNTILSATNHGMDTSMQWLNKNVTWGHGKRISCFSEPTASTFQLPAYIAIFFSRQINVTWFLHSSLMIVRALCYDGRKVQVSVETVRGCRIRMLWELHQIPRIQPL